MANLNREELSWEMILVDDFSDDCSVDFVRSKYPEIKVIENDMENYARAINLGIRNASGQYVALINSSLIVDKNWLKCLISLMEQDDRIGIVQSKILFLDEMRIKSAGIEETEDFYFIDAGFGERSGPKYDRIRELNYFAEESILIRRECLDTVGAFDQDFFMSMENIDYSIRCRNSGWKIFYSPNSIAYLRHSESAQSDEYSYFSARGRLLLLGKHFPLQLARSVRTSYFYLKREQENLYHSLIQAARKLAENNDIKIIRLALSELSEVVPEIFGEQKAINFFSQLEVVFDLRKIKIGIYDHAFHFAGGGQRYVAEMAHILQDEYDVTYIANKDISLDKYREWFEIDLSRCKIKIIKIPFYENRNEYYIDEGLAKIEKMNPFDIINKESINYDIFINANMLSKVKPLSCLSLFICHFPDRGLEKFFSVHNYDYIITNSNFTTYWLKERWGLDTTLRLYPPVDMYSSECDIDKKEKMILSVARFENSGSKKQLQMIDAFSGLCKKDQRIKDEWKLVLAGGTVNENPYYKRVVKRLNKNGVNIEAKKNLSSSEIKNLYCKASIFWHACGLYETEPRLMEHFGMATVEAMQNYCVPVVTNAGGQREIVVHGVNGFRFETLDELESCTLKLISEGDLRRNMAKEAHISSKRFSKDLFKEKVYQFFQEMEKRLRGGEAVELKDCGKLK
jgi:GT2 family glycosyltransferase/glycosyltransferase involved in cell wall biosynthesis